MMDGGGCHHQKVKNHMAFSWNLKYFPQNFNSNVLDFIDRLRPLSDR